MAGRASGCDPSESLWQVKAVLVCCNATARLTLKSEFLWNSTVSRNCPGRLALVPRPLVFNLFNFAIYGNGDRLTRSPAVDRVDLALLPLRVKTAIELEPTQLPSRTNRAGSARTSLQNRRGNRCSRRGALQCRVIEFSFWKVERVDPVPAGRRALCRWEVARLSLRFEEVQRRVRTFDQG